MAILKIIKTHIVCNADNKTGLLNRLQLWGKIELFKSADNPTLGTLTKAKEHFACIEFIIDFLSTYTKKESFWNKLKYGLQDVSLEDIEKTKSEIDCILDYEKIRKIDSEIKKLKTSIVANREKISYLNTIKNLRISQDDLDMNNVDLMIGKIAQEKFTLLDEHDVYYEILEYTENPIVGIFYLKYDMEKINKLLHEVDFVLIELPSDKIPIDTIKQLEQEIIEKQDELLSIEKLVREKFLINYFKYTVLFDYFKNLTYLEEETEKTENTEYTSIISGWMPEVYKNELTNMLDKEFPQMIFVEFQRPSKDDKVPVVLKNNNFTEAFEVVTNLYGTPDSGWIDPTPYFAPFFAIFFGLCLTDAGYGFILSGICIWALKKLKLTGGLKKFIKLLLWGGVASIFAGALTGGWFGDIFKGIKLFDKMMIIDPLKKPEYFLYFSVLLGYVHVIFGVMISISKNISTGNIKTALFEELPWVIMLVAIPVYFLGGIFSLMAKCLLVTGVSGIVFFSGHENKNIFGRIGTGLYNLYGGTDYFKDMISYSRLFALGMGTAILGMAVNEMSKQAIVLPVIGYVLMVIIFIGGHVFNMVMSLLSGYIHTSRLQYVEFFTKFFKGGGRSFEPLNWKNNKVNLVEKVLN